MRTMSARLSSPPKWMTTALRFLIWGFLIAAILLGGLYAYAVWNRRHVISEQMKGAPLSLAALEEQYGLHINLLAVTAAGGMVDLRINVRDAGKAAALFTGEKVVPSIIVTDQQVILTSAEDSQRPGAGLKNGDTLYFMYPNLGSSLQHGAWVTLKIGDVHLEPIQVK